MIHGHRRRGAGPYRVLAFDFGMATTKLMSKEIKQRKRPWKEPNDESSTSESLDESSVSIKGEIRSENTELDLTFDFGNLR